MFDKILNMLEANPKRASYEERLRSIHEFFTKYDLYKELWPKQDDTPLSIVWSVSTNYPEIFYQQLGSIAQMQGIFNPEDEIIFVADRDRRDDVLSSRSLLQQIKTKSVVIRRPFPGDGPALNWDIGIEMATHDRILCLRDLNLFFQPWDMFQLARKAVIKQTLNSMSVVLGPIWSRFADKWLYLSHPQFCPSPFLFAFVLSKQDYLSVNGFDPMLSRGYDHTGELDFLLRWNIKGYKYIIHPQELIFHPGISANSQEELDEMQFQSSINRRYFFDRYGEDFINGLEPPYKTTLSMLEVNHALTYAPLSEVMLDDAAFDKLEEVKDAFTFNKWEKDLLIQEIIE